MTDDREPATPEPNPGPTDRSAVGVGPDAGGKPSPEQPAFPPGDPDPEAAAAIPPVLPSAAAAPDPGLAESPAPQTGEEAVDAQPPPADDPPPPIDKPTPPADTPAPPADKPPPPPGGQNGGDGAWMGRALLVSETAEVYLLLDNISASATKMLPNLDGVTPFDQDGRGWIDQICSIRLPPLPDTAETRARYAAKLLRAKDELTRVARPATSASIAFCLMLADEPSQAWLNRDRGASNGETEPLLDRVLDWISSRTRRSPKQEESQSVEAWRDRLGDGCSRDVLAKKAFPLMHRNMHWSRTLHRFLNIFLVVTLIFTCWMSWQVSTGVALLHRVDGIERDALLLRSAVSRAALQLSPAPDASATPAPPVADGVSQATEPTEPGTTAAPPPPSDELSKAAVELATNALSEPEERAAAKANLMRWVQDNQWLAAVIGGRSQAIAYGGNAKSCPADTAGQCGIALGTIKLCQRACTPYSPSPRKTLDGSVVTASDPNVQWAGVLISVLAVSLLPVLYGVLGSATAVVRSIARYMRNNTLLHRDLVLALTQLALGAVVGACVGLFIGPEGSGEQANGLFGDVTLSEAALCFLAGYGVDSVFRALDSLVDRAFPEHGPPDAATQQSPPPPPRPLLDATGGAGAKQPNTPQN